MKKIVFSAIGIAIFGMAFGQFPYSATVLNEYYVELDNPTSLELGIGWDDPEAQIPLEFSLDIDGNTSGGILMVGGTGEMLMNTTENGLLNILWPISLDLMDIGAVSAEEFSSIRYQTAGEAPNRILKVEWNECGLYDEIASSGTTDARINFQTWVYESGGIIEYRFGPNTLNDSVYDPEFLTSGIILGFDYDYYDGTFYTASGDASAPDWMLTDDFYQWYYSGSSLSGVPMEGTVYRFGPATNVDRIHEGATTFFTYPNPTDDVAWIQNGPAAAEFQVFDATGRMVNSFYLGAGSQSQLPTNAWASGTYTVRSINALGQSSTSRLVVQ